MRVTITLRGSLKKKYFDGEGEREIAVPEGATCAQALRSVGIDWEKDPSFGFVSVNGMRVMIDSALKDGDILKAFSKIGGG